MKIIVDAFGGDNAPLEILKGCAMAVEEYGYSILLTGNEDVIRRVARENDISLRSMEIVHATEVIEMTDHADAVLKTKKDSSLSVAMRLLSEGKGDALVSAGSTGAVVVGGTLLVKRIKGVKRPALAPVMPNSEGSFMLIDCGANVECRPEMLVQFAKMGSIYMEKVLGYSNPRVGLANVGTEETKGDELRLKTYALLKESSLNFVGNVEAREIPGNAAEVIVTDGFTGNIILKLYEGVAIHLMGKVKSVLLKNIKTKLAASVINKDMKRMRQELDYNAYGGAALMGTARPVFKAHGSAKATTMKNAIRLTATFVEGKVIEEIERALNEK